jgi:hypothetical protein
MSTMAPCSAMSMAGRSGASSTAVPIRMRRVRTAIAAAKVSGWGR